MKDKRTINFPLVLSDAGDQAIEQYAQATGQTKADVIRAALQRDFQARGQNIDFSPGKRGQRKKR